MKLPKKNLPLKSCKNCNRCGELVLVYEVFDNAPICESCQEELNFKVKKPKKIMNENQMLTKVLEYKK